MRPPADFTTTAQIAAWWWANLFRLRSPEPPYSAPPSPSLVDRKAVTEAQVIRFEAALRRRIEAAVRDTGEAVLDLAEPILNRAATDAEISMSTLAELPGARNRMMAVTRRTVAEIPKHPVVVDGSTVDPVPQYEPDPKHGSVLWSTEGR